MRWVISMGLGLATLAACGGEGTILPPAPADPSGSGGSGGSPPSTSSSGGDTPTPKPLREVYQRNPYGNVAASGNLLWDGDFEWLSPFAGQYGWIQAASASFFGAGLPKSVIGGACRSGIRCARLEGNNVLIGLAVVSEDNELSASVWIKPEDGSGDCTVVQGLLISQDNVEPPAELLPEPIDDDGWCRLSALVPVRASAQYLYIQNNAFDRTFLVDDAVVQRASEAAADTLLWQDHPTGPVDPETVAQARSLGRKLTEPKDPPDNAARKAFEKRMRRGWRIGGKP